MAGGKTDTSTNAGSVGKGSSVKGANRYEEDEEESSEDTELLDDKLPVGGTYTSKSDVALYIHTYHKLPVNFITKKQAKSLGWTGGSLEEFAPGKCIGGDSFGNYEGMLPTGVEYHECDIGTLGASERGPQRIVYSDDFHIYYTPDHYRSFELLYSP